jgi:hypothetical protein
MRALRKIKAPRTVTFDLPDLGAKMKSIGIDPKSIDDEYGLDQQAKAAADRAKTAAKRAKISAELKPCKYAGTPDQICWDPNDGNGEYGPFPSKEVAINTLMAHRK